MSPAATCSWFKSIRVNGPAHQDPGRGAGPQALAGWQTVVFRRGWDLYSMDVATHKETPLTTHGTETLRNGALDLGLSRGARSGHGLLVVARFQVDCLSPVRHQPRTVFPHEDLLRTRALFEPERYPQAGENNADVHLGVVPAVGGPTTWLDVGDTRNSYLIARAGWMPDSKSVYVIRTNRVQNRLEMLAIAAGSGASSPIFRESDPYWINLRGDVEFLRTASDFCGPASATASAISTCTPSTVRTSAS